ncbi:anti-adapter protein IraM [Cronobacter universalis]|nr:anti-adapter protein IraM [Cronobacter universalis]
MEWLVVDTIVCASARISFSTLWCKIKLIIWYESDVFLPPGSSVMQTNSGIYIDEKFFPITIYNVTPFNKIFWEIIERSNECPGRKSTKGDRCTNVLNCRIAICPYGLVK